MKRKKNTDDKAAATTATNSTESDNKRLPGGPPNNDAAGLVGDTWSETELDALTAEFAEQAKPLDKEDRGIGFGYGRIASGLHAKILNGGKRVPDGEDTFARLAKKLAKLGIKKSRQRLRALAQAYELHAALGGEGKAPALTPDHYVEVAKDGLTLEQKREILETAAEKNMSASGTLRKYVMVKLGELGKEPERDETYWRDWFERSFTRDQSSMIEHYMVVRDRCVELPIYVRDQMKYTAVLLFQVADGPCTPGGAK